MLDVSLSSVPKAVLVAGMGRSGTTWIAELLNFDRSYRIVFEPFRAEDVQASRVFADSRYLRPNERRVELAECARAILHGQIGNTWTDRYRRPLVSTRRIVKTIRANLMLGWLRSSFPTVPIVLVLRHPLAVVGSWRRLGWGTREHDRTDTTAFEGLSTETRLFADFPSLGHLLREIDTDSYLDCYVFHWCVYYAVPLAQLSRSDYCLVRYEDLVLAPERHLPQLFDSVGRAGAEAGLSSVRKPSRTTDRDIDGGLARERLLFGWQDQFSPEETARARELVTSAGLGHLYNSWDRPAHRVD